MDTITLQRSTLRVGFGSGVLIRKGDIRLVLSAAHVVNDATAVVHVVGGDWSGTLQILKREPSVDVLVLADHPSLRGDGLELLEESLAAGEDTWLAGYPAGWKGAEPVLSRGVFAGTGDE